jgi:hypothetical protein
MARSLVYRTDKWPPQSRDVDQIVKADERTRTAELVSLRVCLFMFRLVLVTPNSVLVQAAFGRYRKGRKKERMSSASSSGSSIAGKCPPRAILPKRLRSE